LWPAVVAAAFDISRLIDVCQSLQHLLSGSKKSQKKRRGLNKKNNKKERKK
jgi:hypothetical protein